MSRQTSPPSKLALLRMNAGHSQPSVASELGVHQSVVSRLETGVRGRRALDRYADRLAELYGVSERELYEAAETEPPRR